jgi:hypothetical protein
MDTSSHSQLSKREREIERRRQLLCSGALGQNPHPAYSKEWVGLEVLLFKPKIEEYGEGYIYPGEEGTDATLYQGEQKYQVETSEVYNGIHSHEDKEGETVIEAIIRYGLSGNLKLSIWEGGDAGQRPQGWRRYNIRLRGRVVARATELWKRYVASKEEGDQSITDAAIGVSNGD